MEWKMPKGVFFTCQEPGGQHPEVWVPMESPKGLAMEGSSVIQRKKKKNLPTERGIGITSKNVLTEKRNKI